MDLNSTEKNKTNKYWTDMYISSHSSNKQELLNDIIISKEPPVQYTDNKNIRTEPITANDYDEVCDFIKRYNRHISFWICYC